MHQQNLKIKREFRLETISGQKLYFWQQQAKQQAIAEEIEANEVDWLLQTLTDLTSSSLRLGSFQNRAEVTLNIALSELDRLWQQRLQNHTPVQYLVETVFWRHFQLKVTPAVLIPRPETELIIDIARDAIEDSKLDLDRSHWVDLGTGSGAIALGLADLLPQATIHAVDCSSAALAIARENASRLDLAARINFYCGSWWNPLEKLKGKVMGVVSNPPYIPSAEIPRLQPEVVQHEPHLALDGGVDGLDDIRYLIESAPHYLIAGGILILEMAIAQANLVMELLAKQKEYYDIKVIKDLNGIERFVLAYKS